MPVPAGDPPLIDVSTLRTGFGYTTEQLGAALLDRAHHLMLQNRQLMLGAIRRPIASKNVRDLEARFLELATMRMCSNFRHGALRCLSTCSASRIQDVWEGRGQDACCNSARCLCEASMFTFGFTPYFISLPRCCRSVTA